MLHSVLVLIAFQLLGEFIQATFDLPIHGAICGMLLLLLVLIVRGRVSAPLRTTSNALFQYLPLILIPPSVGVMTQWRFLIEQPLALGAVIVISTAIGLAVSGLLFERLAKHKESAE